MSNIIFLCKCHHRFTKDNVHGKFTCPNCGTVYVQYYDKENKEFTWDIERKNR